MTPMRVAIIGAGLRTVAFCKYIAENPQKIKLMAMVDINQEKAKFLDKKYQLNAEICANYDRLMDRDDIDAIMVATPDYAHVAPTIAALKANKDVFLEKPEATTVEDCDAIIAVAERSLSICYLGFNLRHSPVHEKIHHLITEGKLGKITTIEANECYYGGKTYFRRWNRLRKYSGGLWVTKACHDFDFITWIAGGKPNSVFATASLSHYKPIPDAGPRCRDCVIKGTCPDFFDVNKPVDHWYEEAWRQLELRMDQRGPMSPDICLYNSEKDTFDNGIALIEYDNDVRATYTVNILAARSTRHIQVIGTDGTVEGDTEQNIVHFTQRHTEKRLTYDLRDENTGSHGGADEKILHDFFRVCQNRESPRSGLLDGRLAVVIASAATQSSDTGKVIKMSQKL
ncbi:MAG: hypothetical protein A2Y12_05460 [Planctomycetes bacterium GWF2_42_9]|nr:MAG: hypothetical protein A2Y12_05460 [Planctomycetes bacterium GWF2_42_9]